MTGYEWRTFWRAYDFCATNGYEAIGKKLFYKQTADYAIVFHEH